jgi:hypothetical protein
MSLIWTVLQSTLHSFFQFRIVSLPWFQPFEYCYIPSERETVSQNHTKRFIKWQRIFSRIQHDSNKIQIKNQYATIHGDCRNGREIPTVLCIVHKKYIKWTHSAFIVQSIRLQVLPLKRLNEYFLPEILQNIFLRGFTLLVCIGLEWTLIQTKII